MRRIALRSCCLVASLPMNKSFGHWLYWSMQVGKEAARSNTSIYTLYLDTSSMDRFAAQVQKSDKNLQSEARDSEVLGRWLDQFSGAAGGALFRVQVGSGEYAFNRVLNEISAYYLLGVEPAEEDRDGRTHEIKVKTNQKNVILRGRRWVTVPKRDGGPDISSEGAAEAPAATDKPAPPARRVIPADVQAIADAFDQGEANFQRTLGQTQDLATLLRNFRAADAPWPNAPRRTAVLALELSVAALRSDNRYARDEGGRLLAEYNVRVKQPGEPDAFECSWLWTEVAALEGLFMSRVPGFGLNQISRLAGVLCAVERAGPISSTSRTSVRCFHLKDSDLNSMV